MELRESSDQRGLQSADRWVTPPASSPQKPRAGFGAAVRASILRILGLADAQQQAAAAQQACKLAQRAASQALAFAQSARDSADAAQRGTGGPATGRGGRLDDDIEDSQYPGR